MSAAEDRVAREVMAAAAVETSRATIGPTLDAVAKAGEAVKLTQVRYRAGTGTATDIIEAFRDLDAARLALVDALSAADKAQLQLLASVGELDGRTLTR